MKKIFKIGLYVLIILIVGCKKTSINDNNIITVDSIPDCYFGKLDQEDYNKYWTDESYPDHPIMQITGNYYKQNTIVFKDFLERGVDVEANVNNGKILIDQKFSDLFQEKIFDNIDSYYYNMNVIGKGEYNPKTKNINLQYKLIKTNLDSSVLIVENNGTLELYKWNYYDFPGYYYSDKGTINIKNDLIVDFTFNEQLFSFKINKSQFRTQTQFAGRRAIECLDSKFVDEVTKKEIQAYIAFYLLGDKIDCFIYVYKPNEWVNFYSTIFYKNK